LATPIGGYPFAIIFYHSKSNTALNRTELLSGAADGGGDDFDDTGDQGDARCIFAFGLNPARWRFSKDGTLLKSPFFGGVLSGFQPRTAGKAARATAQTQRTKPKGDR
jgi:hypothetical protein